MEKHLFLGDEAIAQAAIDAGISGVYAYPGTPSTEITEYIQGSPVTKERGIHCRWSANEKTAMEAALGMCYAGKRAIFNRASGVIGNGIKKSAAGNSTMIYNGH